jgi:hypothetical protein
MARSKKQAQALAIKLSRERRSGKEVPAPPKGRYSEKTRRRALTTLRPDDDSTASTKRPPETAPEQMARSRKLTGARKVGGAGENRTHA